MYLNKLAHGFRSSYKDLGRIDYLDVPVLCDANAKCEMQVALEI